MKIETKLFQNKNISGRLKELFWNTNCKVFDCKAQIKIKKQIQKIVDIVKLIDMIAKASIEKRKYN